MAFYNSSVKTNVFDPILTLDNNRAEWQLPAGSLYLSSLRLHNLGAFLSAGAPIKWNTKGGIYSYIRNITLYDGSVILDQLRNVSEYMAFKNYNKANRNNVSLEKIKKGHSYGYTVGNTDDGTINNAWESKSITADRETTPRYALDLREVLPMLRNSQFLPGQLFQNLRLVIEFKRDRLSTLQDNTSMTNLTTLTDTLLVVDELVNDAVVQQALTQYQGVAFSAIENDAFVVQANALVNAANTSATDTTSTILHGFQDKFVNRLLMFVSPMTALAAVGVAGGTGVLTSGGALRAARLNGEILQVRLNGANMFGGTGISTSAEKLAMLHDTWGMCNHAPGTELLGLFSQETTADGISSPEYVADMMNSNSYFGCFIRDRIASLQVDITQTQYIPVGSAFPQVIDNAVQFNQDIMLGGQAQQINVFGEVRKSIIVEGSNYRVLYN